MGETLLYGLQVTLIGMGIVFLGLIILVCLFKLMSLIVRSLEGRGKPEDRQDEIVATASPVPAAPAVSAFDEDESEIAAVIAAAVAAMGENDNLVVRSIRRVGVNSPSWNAQGRIDMVNSRN